VSKKAGKVRTVYCSFYNRFGKYPADECATKVLLLTRLCVMNARLL
jgi:hypothetical protein